MIRSCLAFAVLTITAAARAASPAFDTIYRFSGKDGNLPIAPVTAGPDILYGTTTFGGPLGFGTVYSLTPPATPQGAWTETVLHEFTAKEGFAPFASVTIGAGGVLFGTTYLGGPQKSGTVYSLAPPSSPGGTWTETTLHAFSGTPGGGSVDGGNPNAPVTIGPGGVLFGTTTYGGNHGVGTLFALAPPSSPGGAWTETVIHNFGNQFDGAEPIAGLVIGGDGTLYGTTYIGGTSDAGTVFSVTPPASPAGAWTEKVLHSFTGGDDGGAPYFGTLAMDSQGVLYGTTETGGVQLTGTAFSLAPPASPGGAWTETVLHNFIARSGKLPLGGLALDAAGDLFGTTSSGGAQNAGTVFAIRRSGGSYTVLHDFTANAANGAVPYAGVTPAPGGVLVGATSGLNPGGASNAGTVFVIRP